MDPQGEVVALNLILHLFRPATSIIYQSSIPKTTVRVGAPYTPVLYTNKLMLWWCMTVTLAKALSPPIVVTALSTFWIFAGCSTQMYCLFGILNHSAGSDARSRSDSRGGAMRAKGVVGSVGSVCRAAERGREVWITASLSIKNLRI